MKLRRRLLNKVLILILILIPVIAGATFIVDYYIRDYGSEYIVDNDNLEEADAIIILGTFVSDDGTPSPRLEDRLLTGLELYQEGKAPKIIVSGDHGRVDYDEVNGMKNYLMERGVPDSDIFMDHAGFSTYESMYRQNIYLRRTA